MTFDTIPNTVFCLFFVRMCFEPLPYWEKIKFFHTKTVPIEKLGYLLSKADIHLIFLKNEFSSIVLPSKIYCLIKSKKSIIYIGPKSSDLCYLIKKQKNENFQIDINDENSVKDVLKKLSR